MSKGKKISRPIVLIIICACILNACRSGVDNPVSSISLRATNSYAPISVTEGKTQINDIYFLLSTISVPYHYKLARLSTTCLLTANKCPKLEFIGKFPETEYSQSEISWSPNGKYALINNSYNGSVLLVDPVKSTVETFATGLLLTAERIIWSPDSKCAAVITTGKDEFSSKVVLLNPENGDKRELPLNLDGTIMPLGWQNGDTLLLYLYQYGLPGKDPTEKKVVIDAKIIVLNIHNYQVANIPTGGVSWKLISDVPELSPDRSLLAFSLRDLNSPLYIIGMDGVITKTIESFGNNPTWSPDGKWIAGVFPKLSGKELTACEVHIVNLENTGLIIFQTKLCPSISWLVDSNHLLTIFSIDDDLNNKAIQPLQIITIDDKNIFIPEVDFTPYQILKISIRPQDK